MKKLIFTMLLLKTALALPALAGAQTACLTNREIIPYSPYEQIEVTCDGKRLEVTALFGKNIVQKFKFHIKNQGYQIIGTIGKNLVISKRSKEELGVDELCSVVKVSYLKEFSFICEESMGWSIKTTKEADLRRYLESHKFKILNTDPYVLGR